MILPCKFNAAIKPHDSLNATLADIDIINVELRIISVSATHPSFVSPGPWTPRFLTLDISFNLLLDLRVVNVSDPQPDPAHSDDRVLLQLEPL